MEKRQPLDLSAPLLSVRRYSSPICSSELAKPSRQQSPAINKRQPCGDELVTKPASVPFHWEQIPGRPKYSIESQGLSGSDRFISGEIPKPPARKLSSGPSRFASGDQNLALYGPRFEPFSYAEHARLVEKLKESLRCDDSESDEDAFSDALDKLSCSESHSPNCSVISGCRGSMGMKHSGKFSVDPAMRELMLARFLPAAKAAVLETPPQYDVKTKKEPSLAEKKPAKKEVSGKIEKPLVGKYSLETYHSKQYIRNEENEGEEDNDYPAPNKKPSKRWGIIPRLCVKSSLRLLNPLPGLRSSKSQPQTPSTGEVRRLTRNALSGPLDKIACTLPHKKKFHSGLLSREISSIESKPSKELDQSSKPRDSSSSAASSSSLRRYRSGNLSPNRSKVPNFPLPTEVAGYYNDSRLAASRKLFKALTDVSMNQKTEKSNHFPISKPSLPKAAGETQALEVDRVSSEIKRVIKEERRSQSQEIVVKSTLGPSLPKSPSESWLWRAIPSGNPCVHSSRKSPVRTKDHGPKGSNADAKWETIVKSSNLHRDRVHDSQDLTTRPPSQRQAGSSEMGTIKN